MTLALALVATVVLVSRPEPTTTTPPTPPPVTPGPEPLVGLVDQPVWADAGGLHIGTRQYDVGSDITQITLLWTGVVYVDANGDVWLQPPSGAPDHIGRHALRATLAASDDGVTAAWIERIPGIGNPELQLVSVDATATDQPTRVTVPHAPSPDGNRDPHVAADPAIEYVTADDVILRVRPDGERLRLDRTTGAQTTVPTPSGFSVLDRTQGLIATAPYAGSHFEVRVSFRDETGRTVAQVQPVERVGVFNQGGAWFLTVAQTSRGHAVRVVDPRTGEIKHLTGDSPRYPIVSWGYGRTALVNEVSLDDSEPPRLWACDVRTSVCNSVALESRGGVVLPGP